MIKKYREKLAAEAQEVKAHQDKVERRRDSSSAAPPARYCRSLSVRAGSCPRCSP